MFNHAFYTRVEWILAALRETRDVSLLALGRCLSNLKGCLLAAEVDEATVRHFTDLILDRYNACPAVPGNQFADEILALLEELPGLGDTRTPQDAWSDDLPAIHVQESGARRWDIKEFDNRLTGTNRASLVRLRMAMGPVSERRVPDRLDLRGQRDFKACVGMTMADRHDAGIDGEQIDRLIRRLGRDHGPDGGRPAIIR